ncbi:MAG: DUF2202 domain-containing protein [Chloroflexi bacterium]|nr:DUF2202 domain-containing protein [Chloroflexota bacterium]
MKRFFTMLAVGILGASLLTACAEGSTLPTTLTTTEPATAETPVDTATEAPTEAATEAPTEVATENPTETPTEATDTTTSGLTTEEREGLLYMREEEKLARDVYLTLYEIWGHQTFANIAKSEEQHMAAVLGLLQTYGLEDPAAGKGVGEFTNPELQALYDELIERGRQSLAEALKVGGAIEEIDIIDLKERIAQTDKADIITVYENLMEGSKNHLRAFSRALQQATGETYTPQYLSQEEYDTIMAEGDTQGGQGQGRGRGRGRSSGG